MTTNILLCTFNARFRHTAFGLRYLMANLGEWHHQAAILEFDLEDDPRTAAETILAHAPKIVGFGVYIWNAELTTKTLRILKQLQPHLIIVLGGPELIQNPENHPTAETADYLISGEGEIAFRQLCTAILTGSPPPERIIQTTPLHLAELHLPYDLYTEKDIAQRVIYLEATRGCPYRCAFCLSALDRQVRRFPQTAILAALESLWQRGVRQFKWVDRSFNLGPEPGAAILTWLLDHWQPELFIHLEVMPDHLPDWLREILVRFPPGTLQLEVGIQSFNPQVLARIGRKQENQRTEANIHWLLTATRAHIHTDLILGLPGEDVAGFAAGFDRLVALNPHEIQVGILKRLRGAPIEAVTKAFGMIYNPDPPYDLLCHDRIDFPTMQELKRLARYWDLIGNSGRFPATLAWLRQSAAGGSSVFASLRRLGEWLYQRVGRTHGIALAKLFDLLEEGLVVVGGATKTEAKEVVGRDREKAQRATAAAKRTAPPRQTRCQE